MPARNSRFLFFLLPHRPSRVLGAAIAFVLLPACMQLQNRVNEHESRIVRLERELARTDRSLSVHRADARNELDKIRSEIQELRGTIEQSTYHTRKDMASLNAQLDELKASLRDLARGTKPAAATPAASSTDNESVRKPQEAEAVSPEKALYQKAHGLRTEGRLDEAREVFQQFLSIYPESTLADNALYWTGSCYFQKKNHEKAIAVLDDVIKRYPRGNKVPEAYYLQARAFIELQDTLAARIVLETLIEKFPGTDAAARAEDLLEQVK